MPRCHEHNILEEVADEGPFGIRLTVLDSDPFASLVGSEWEKFKWYPTETMRDSALIEMARQHQYSRSGDRPTLRYEKVQKQA
ncbi:MAG: hypothetical protein AAF438_08780 [Pseudomonadota bacterium]